MASARPPMVRDGGRWKSEIPNGLLKNGKVQPLLPNDPKELEKKGSRKKKRKSEAEEAIVAGDPAVDSDEDVGSDGEEDADDGDVDAELEAAV